MKQKDPKRNGGCQKEDRDKVMYALIYAQCWRSQMSLGEDKAR
jgi:hypothetical protein